MKCKFDKAWIGLCGKPADDSGFCEEHKVKKCCSCGKQATHDCAETMGLVCGADLCDDCEHEISEDGTNGYSFKHCPKNKQKHKPWYMRNEV